MSVTTLSLERGPEQPLRLSSNTKSPATGPSSQIQGPGEAQQLHMAANVTQQHSQLVAEVQLQPMYAGTLR